MLGQRIEAAKPETIVIMTPHGLQVEGMIPLLDSVKVKGETGRVASMGGYNHAFSLECMVDRELNTVVDDVARKIGAPVIQVNTGFSWQPLELDYGVLVPLWFMGAMFVPQPHGR